MKFLCFSFWEYIFLNKLNLATTSFFFLKHTVFMFSYRIQNNIFQQLIHRKFLKCFFFSFNILFSCLPAVHIFSFVLFFLCIHLAPIYAFLNWKLLELIFHPLDFLFSSVGLYTYFPETQTAAHKSNGFKFPLRHLPSPENDKLFGCREIILNRRTTTNIKARCVFEEKYFIKH